MNKALMTRLVLIGSSIVALLLAAGASKGRELWR